MKRRTHTAAWRPGAAVSCLAIAACTAAPPTPVEPPAPSVTLAVARLAQRGHGGEATFELCRNDTCPQPTPKTLTTTPGALPSAAPPAASIAPAQAHGAIEADERPGTPIEPPAPEPPEPPPVQQVSVHFPFASARLDAAARAALRETAPQLAQAREITLSGRTDSIGPDAANDWLAQARARSVLREFLLLAPGIASRVNVDAQGACCFAESNNSPAGRARNRRVEIRYRLGSDAPP